MSIKQFRDTTRMLVYDPVAPNRNATRASFYSLGYRNVEGVADLGLLAENLTTNPPDLLVAEVSGAERETCALLQSVRLGHLGDNPFIVIVATTWRRDSSIVNQVLNSGADDLIARPIATAALGERVRLLAERRKDFVITSDYIGPDRRRMPRTEGKSAKCLEVPNPLKFRSLDNLTQEEVVCLMTESVEHSKEVLNLERMRREAVQLCVQERILGRQTPGAQDFCEGLPRIGRLAAEIKRRAVIARQEAAQDWCDKIAQSIRTLTEMSERTGAARFGADYRPVLGQLSHASLALGRMLAGDEVEPESMVELDNIVAVRMARSSAAA